MTDATKHLHDVLEADASRRASGGGPAAPRVTDAPSHSAQLRFRLVNTFPRQTRPVFAKLRAALAPYGYTLSPLHPAHDLTFPRMQSELARLPPEESIRFAPLVFELESLSETLRVYVRQFGGRAAPDFAERRIGIGSTLDLAAVEDAVSEYIVCMVEAQRAPAAAA